MQHMHIVCASTFEITITMSISVTVCKQGKAQAEFENYHEKTNFTDTFRRASSTASIITVLVKLPNCLNIKKLVYTIQQI